MFYLPPPSLSISCFVSPFLNITTRPAAYTMRKRSLLAVAMLAGSSIALAEYQPNIWFNTSLFSNHPAISYNGRWTQVYPSFNSSLETDSRYPNGVSYYLLNNTDVLEAGTLRLSFCGSGIDIGMTAVSSMKSIGSPSIIMYFDGNLGISIMSGTFNFSTVPPSQVSPWPGILAASNVTDFWNFPWGSHALEIYVSTAGGTVHDVQIRTGFQSLA